MPSQTVVMIDPIWLAQHDQHLVAALVELEHAIALLSHGDTSSKEVARGRKHLALDRCNRAAAQIRLSRVPWLEAG